VTIEDVKRSTEEEEEEEEEVHCGGAHPVCGDL